MKFTVAWKPRAENELAAIWMNSSNPAAITEAANRIDAVAANAMVQFAFQPHRIIQQLYLEPLGIAFEFSPTDRLITIIAVWEL